MAGLIPYLLVLGAGAALSWWASRRVKSTFAKYSAIGTQLGATGAEIAERILADNDIRDVTVEPVAGTLSDHYDPRSKTLRLSEPVYGGRSMAAFGVAAHEVGHAIQHARAYSWLGFRSAWVPVASIGGNLSGWILMAGILMGGLGTAFGSTLSVVGVVLFATTTIFTLITLPVEFDASKRAMAALSEGGYVTRSEYDGAKNVLDAAAMTYVAAFLSSLLMLLYYVFILLGSRGND